MRLTVGPLPPAVYWRRRAVVLGAGLLFLIVLLYSCTGQEPKNTSADGAGPSGKASTSTPRPTESVLTPKSGSPSPTPEDSGSGADGGADGGQGGPTGGGQGGPASGGSGTDASVAPVVDDGTCADSEIQVTPVALPATAQRGTVVTLRFKIKNVSGRTCSRDVGSGPQELYIKAGADKVWSSDTCGTARESDVQSFTPNFERSYELGWNGRYSNRCANGLAAGEFVPAGTYQLLARLDTKISKPVQLTITN
ncbi:hypothetical protein [Micromonospora narathiwatensis]|uniref:Uncharacterized protein n=1 Tax=Micromonospora narathiwatensis TaxID=299146 RepID=A0A1A9A8K7_9ACTN|nr:hypothetical protein [Micromonospora narathiwatensis]SBT52448.1 hypothetical protein GA0070621_4425 [Micromonospora narathiwatensis]